MNKNSKYDLITAKAPVLRGQALRLFVSLVEGPLGKLIMPKLFNDIGMTAFLNAQAPDEGPTYKPIHFSGRVAVQAETMPTSELPKENPNKDVSGFHFNSAFDFAEAYKNGTTTPEEVAERVIEAIQNSNSLDKPLRAIVNSKAEEIRKQADASAKRHKIGQPLSALDGVPVSVKEEMNAQPYPTTLGTTFIKIDSTFDATVVARLRAAGAIIIGKANMHEIGIGVTGLNPHFGTARNPYDLDHHTGGSSSGSGASVGSGLAVVSSGADGGGSIRIPAGLCGVVGLKPTFGSVSSYGVPPLDWSIGHVGPIGATVSDVALAWGAIAGPDLNDSQTIHQPIPTLNEWDKTNLSDLTIGVFWDWFNDASEEIVAVNKSMLEKLKSMGAKIKDIEIPDLEYGRTAHLVIIISEMGQAMQQYRAEHLKDHGLDVRSNLATGAYITSMDLIKALRVRTLQINNFNKIFEDVDIIITPNIGITAPKIHPKALPNGESDLATVMALMRFIVPANMTGNPALAFPVGYSSEGLPISMQAIGRPWEDHKLFRIGLAAEQNLERKKPALYYNYLEK